MSNKLVDTFFEEKRIRKEDFKRESDVQEIAKSVAEALNITLTLPADVHKEHHDFIEMIRPWIETQIEKEKARTKFCQECTEAVVKWGIIGLLGFLVYRIYHGEWPS